MLPTEGEEDLLEQLSGELGIPEFLQDLPMLEDNAMSGHGTIYDSLINDIPATTSASGSLFPDFSNALIDTKDCMTIDFSTTTFPPSPSNSDTSSGGSTVEPKDCLVAPISFTEVSPPVSPPSMMNLPAIQSGSIVSVPDLANIKIPIPKIQKPKVTNQPLILTSNQLAQLSNGGVLQLNAGNATTNATAANGSMVIKSEPNPLTLGATPTVQNVSSEDLKSLKRQQRMIKNRESACLSRKKKKEYVTSLEEQLNALAKENLQLKRENESLKQRLRHHEGCSDPTSGPKVGSNAKRATAVFALLCIVSLNIGSLSSVYKNNHDSLLQPHDADTAAFKVANNDILVNNHIVHGSGRSLLWAPAVTDPSSSESNNTDYVPKCSLYFNQSESIRLDKQLRGWFQPEESLRNATSKEKDAPISPIVQVKKEQPSVTSLGPYAKPKASRLSSGFYQMLISDPEYKTGITLYNQDTPRFTYESFFEAIHRRDDTFYVVSFSGDHLLLPASARNGSSRPRMSLLLPSLTVPLNDSMQPPENHVAMMQIDCEVINTRLLHIHQDSIPAHLSQGMRAETSNASLQRNDSNEEQGIHHHQYEEFNATRPSQTPKYRSSHLYKKSSSSAANNQNPSLENTDFIEDGHYIQLTSSKSRNLHGNLANKKKRHFKLSEHRFSP